MGWNKYGAISIISCKWSYKLDESFASDWWCVHLSLGLIHFKYLFNINIIWLYAHWNLKYCISIIMPKLFANFRSESEIPLNEQYAMNNLINVQSGYSMNDYTI